MSDIASRDSNLIFVSSTYRDLKDHRQAVLKALEATDIAFDAMEIFGSEPSNPLQICLDKVRQSKVMILVIAFRYGIVDERTGKSYTQLEYEEARRCGIPVYAYLMSESHPVSDNDSDEGELRNKLVAFREEVKRNQLVSTFTAPDNLAVKVLQDMFKYTHTGRFSIKAGERGNCGKKIGNGNYGARINWRDYNGIFQIKGYHIAYIPIVNTPMPGNSIKEYIFHDLAINLSTIPYQLPKNFSTDDDYIEYGSKCCRLCGYDLPDSRIKLRLSETKYIDYMRSGERLDYPSKEDPDKTYRELFGSKINPEAGAFELFDLTNICGCGIFILTRDQYLLASLHPDDTRVYPGRLTYSASGTMKFGSYPHPFTEILYKTMDEINHQVDLTRLKLLSFGADARKLFFQFSFLEESEATFNQIVEKCREKDKDLRFRGIYFDLHTIVEALVNGLWEPSAEAFLLTLCIQRFSFEAVLQELDSHRRKWGRREILDEWDYRASHESVFRTLTIRYPRDQIEKISKGYIDAIMKFMNGEFQRKNILEVGSGDGRITLRLVKDAKSITCVDICEKMITKSKEALKEHLEKVTYHNVFVQDFCPEKTYDIAVISQVLIHNVDEKDFVDFISTVAKCANIIYVFEDVTQNRKTSVYTKLRSQSEIIQAFNEQRCKLVKIDEHMMHKDHIVMLKFEKE